MTISFTGITYIFLTIVLVFVTFRFFRYWRKEKTLVSKVYFYAFFLLGLISLCGALAGTVFSENAEGIRWILIISSFFIAFANAYLGYLFFYLKFPRISPWWGFGAILLFGVIVSILTITVPINPVLEPNGGMDWGLPLHISILRSLIYFFGMLPLATVILKEFRVTTDPFVKTKALFLSLIFSLAMIAVVVDFILEPILGTEALLSEITLMFLAVICAIVYSLSKLLQPTKYVKKIF